MTRISDMTPLAALPVIGAYVPVEKSGSTSNYRYDLSSLAGQDALFTNAATFSVPAETDMVATTGYSVLGVGSAIYIYDASVNSAYVIANPRSSFVDTSGRGFRLSLEQDIAPEMLGATGLGVADDYPAFQAAINLLPAAGGSLSVLSGGYRLDTEPTWGSKLIDWKISPAATFSGAGAANFPGTARNFSKGLTAGGIVNVDMGTSSVPGAWLKTSLNSAWPGFLIENTIHGANSQIQLYWKRWDASGNPLVWQGCIDVDNNGGFKGLFNIEPIDITGPGVIATPISMARTGEVGFGDIPISGIQGTFRGKVRSLSVGGAQFGQYEFGDGTAYLYGDSTLNKLGIYFGNTAYANFTNAGLYPAVTNAYDIGSSSLRIKDYWGTTADFTGNVNTAGAYKVGGTTVIDSSRNSTPVSVAIGGGTALTKDVVYTPTLTPASVAAATVAEQTFTVTGLTTADKVIVNPPAIANSTGIAGARVSAADTLALRFCNPTAGALTPSSGVYAVLAFRS